jgi:hypothetical protein
LPPPSWLHTTSFSAATQPVAIAIRATGPNTWHTGVLYRDQDEPLIGRLLHLAFHRDLRSDIADGRYWWVEVAVEEELLSSVAAMCRSIWLQRQRGQEINYGVGQALSQFNFDGILRLAEGECGLTCATFVHAVFRDSGAILLKLDSWPARSDDAEFKAWVIGELHARGVDEQYIGRVQAEPQSARLRPTEVAGAGVVAQRPASFVQARMAADHIEIA